jgi:hypothetical protein
MLVKLYQKIIKVIKIKDLLFITPRPTIELDKEKFIMKQTKLTLFIQHKIQNNNSNNNNQNEFHSKKNNNNNNHNNNHK